MFKILIQNLSRFRASLALLHQTGCAIPVLLLLSVVPVSASEPGPDVRVVVDISGSMKKNDPDNLRRPAIKLLSNLLPSNSRAGIWTFGQYVNELVPLAPVTPGWKQQAIAAADQIGSTGLFTHIGLSLQRASRGWDTPSAAPRHVILLTDGVVDISKDPRDNQVAREELVNQILPALKAAGAKLHTIALSADADTVLLQQLARETDGMYEVARNADELNQIFLRLFEQAAPRDALPLFDNGFVVDASVDEITVLVFRQSGAEPAALMAPDGSRHTLAAHPADWRWHSDARYDLITVAKPAVGQWQIVAQVDPDNRVLVVSKLGLQVNALPTLALAGEKMRLELTLTENNAPIARKDFLQLVQATARIHAEGYDRELPLKDVGDGHFVADWEVPALDATFQLAMEASAPTFQRARKFNLQAVATPVQATVAVDEQNQADVRFSVAAQLFKPESLVVKASHLKPDASTLPVELTGAGEQWQATITDTTPGAHSLQWQFEALTVAGRPIQMQGPALTWQVAGAAESAPASQTPATAEAAPAETTEAAAAPGHASAEPPAADEEATKGGIPWLWIGLALNVVLVGIGGAFWWVRRRHRQAAQTIEQALADDEVGET